MKKILLCSWLVIALVMRAPCVVAEQGAACLSADCPGALAELRSSLSVGERAQFTWWTLSVYSAQLRLPKAPEEQNPILMRPKVLEITYDRGFTREDFVTSGESILEDNPAVDTAAPAIRSCLDQLAALYKPVKEGDTYSIVHTQSGQLELWLNDALLGSACSEASTRAYFSIWLSAKHSIKDSFQAQLVGSLAANATFIPMGGSDEDH